MDATVLQRYDRPVPRYTSYPTAPHFSARVGAETYRQWLAGIGPRDGLSLYLHVPFCHEMCWYCGCHTKAVRQYEPVGDYANILRQEAELLAATLPKGPRIAHLHWGGGTPTILSADDFAAVMDALHERFAFAADAELATELDPRTLGPETVAVLARCGINRASLGVQDFNEDVQRAVNRLQPFSVTETAVRRLRDAGIAHINFDLMYGLPLQSVDGVLRTVDLAAQLRPNRIALFGYAHVPWMKTHQKMIDEAALPDGPERLRQAEAAAARLVEHGYRRIGLDHFALSDDALAKALAAGRLHRNFQGYTTDRAGVLLGLGASAIGSLAPGYVQNAVPLRGYAKAIAAGEFAVGRGLALSPDDRRRRAVIERLMCDLTVDLDQVGPASDQGFAAELADLDEMRRDGLVEIEGSRLTIPEEHRLLIRTVCAVFDRYLASGVARHSRAV
jgi:oxygen-independent coproporphyrinogen-3 oxidase